MKPKRVDCSDCEHFIWPEFENGYGKKPTTKYGCKLGKRVMFRMPKIQSSYMAQDWGGWFRYCNDFKSKQDESTEMS